MKRIIFFVALLSFSCVAAQETQLFNAEEYLKKKRGETDRLNENPLLKKRPLVLPLANTQATFSHKLQNGNKVFILPQDHMPCVVPDMSLLTEIPNVRPGKVEGVMPNPGIRNNLLIPDHQ